MGILSDIADFESVNFKDIYDKLRRDPERAFIGAIDPFSSWMWGSITGKDYEPLINQLGGPYGGGALGTDNYGGVYEKAENKGVNTYPSAASHDVAEMISAIYGMQGASSGLGSAFGGGASSAAGSGGVLSGGDAAAMEAASASAAGGTVNPSMGMSAPAQGFNWSGAAQQGMGLLGQARGQQQPTAVAAPPQQQQNNSLQQRVAMQRRIQELRQKPRKSLAEQQELQELMRNSQGLL